MPNNDAKSCFLEDPLNATREAGGFTLTQAGMALVGGQLERLPILCAGCRRKKQGCFTAGDPPLEVLRPMTGVDPDKDGHITQFRTFHLDRGLLDAENSRMWWTEP